MDKSTPFSIMVHGGAGKLDSVTDHKIAVRYLESIKRILRHGRDILQLGGSAMQSVEACASLLEDDPIFNAGCGSVLNENGRVQMDAAIMDGHDLSAGAVAAIENIANPVQLAHLIMKKSNHVMLVGEGAARFAGQYGISRLPETYFHTPERIEQLKQAQRKHKVELDHDDSATDSNGAAHDTIGAVARDVRGNLAAATSTGGMTNKSAGRVGDSPLVGAGLYADNQTCAVSATGYGEDLMRTVISKTIADFIEMKAMDAQHATQCAMEYLTRKVKGRGGVIVIDKYGNCASGFTTKGMVHGWIEHGGDINVSF